MDTFLHSAGDGQDTIADFQNGDRLVLENYLIDHRDLTFADLDGDQNIKSVLFAVDRVNERGGVLGKKLELVAFDNKGQPAETLLTMQKMVDDNLSIMMNCGPSNVASALVAAVDKNNERNPERSHGALHWRNPHELIINHRRIS